MREGYRPANRPDDCPPSVLVLNRQDVETLTADQVMRAALFHGATTEDKDELVRLCNKLIYWIVYEENPGRVIPQTEWALRQAQMIKEGQAIACNSKGGI